jgi:peptide/nickel transport system ATP-binding protein
MREYRSNVGYVQQDPYGALPPFMNVQTILEEPMIINGILKIKRTPRPDLPRHLKKLR